MLDQLLTTRAPSLTDDASATFSPCRTYRYELTRDWHAGPTRVTWIMCNPSTADAFTDDPTIRRCIGFTRTWDSGYGGLRVLNLFGLRSTNPARLYEHHDPVGPDNDAVIRAFIANVDGPVVAAWGAHGQHLGRGAAVAAMFADARVPLLCLGVTRLKQPRHPLYLAADSELADFPTRGGR